MNSVILSKFYNGLPICKKEILRYAGCREADSVTEELLQSCINEIEDKLVFKVCYCELELKIDGDICDFGAFRLQSEDLALNLKTSEKVILFAATIGVEVDRLIAKYGRISPSKALMFQAIGAERIEALCERFCADIAKDYNAETMPRFSPGYGDLPILVQKDIFSVLEPGKRIGLTLNDSLLMTPSKSVTAFVGLLNEKFK